MTPSFPRDGVSGKPGGIQLGTWYLVLGTWYLVLGTWYLVLGTWYLVLGTWYLVLGTWYLVLGTWYLVLGTWYLVLGTWYLVLGTWYLHIGPGLLSSRESVRYEIGFSGNGRPALFSHYLVDVPVRESRSWLNQFARGVPFGLVAVALLCLVLYMQVNHFAVSWRAALGKVLNFSTWVDEWESSALVSFSWVGFLTRIGRHTVPCRVSGCRGQDHRDRERCARIQGMAEGPSCRTDEG